MMINGRNQAQGHEITTNDDRRRERWQRIFGRDRLPVLAARPRPACYRDGERLVFDLDMARLPQWSAIRLAADVSRRTARPYREVLADIELHGVTIEAAGCELVKTAVPKKRPFFVWPGYPQFGKSLVDNFMRIFQS